jgi:hypothetical protein
MRARSVLSSTALVLVVAGSIAGCALVYGYGDYHAATTGGAEGGTGGTGPGSSGPTMSTGGGGTAGGGTAGGGGFGCATSASGELYGVSWSRVFGNGKPIDVAAAGLGASGDLTVAGTFSGTLDVGGKSASGGAHKAMLVARFNSQGGTRFAEGFKGGGDVQATALGFDASDNPTAVASFDDTITVGGSTWMLNDSPGIESAVIALAANNGAVQPAGSHHLMCKQNTGDQSCFVRVASVGYYGPGPSLYLAGSLQGQGYFSDDQLVNVDSRFHDGWAASWGNYAFLLTGNQNGDAATGFAQKPGGTDLVLGTISDSTAIDAGATNECNNINPDGDDILLGRFDLAHVPTVTCSNFITATAGNQEGDVLVLAQDGGFFVAGRADSTFTFLGQAITLSAPGVFVARVTTSFGVAWSATIPLQTKDPVHLAVSADDMSAVLSGTFTGMLPTETGDVMSNGKANGFVALIDGTGNATWTRAFVPCSSSGGSTSLVASFTDALTIDVAGTFSSAAMFAGTRFDPKQGGPSLLVAELHKH